MKLIKWVIGLLVAGVVLLGTAAVVLLWVVDPNEYKPWIERAVEEATGRRLQIEGDLALTVFPWLGVQVAGVSLANAPGFGPAPMVEVGTAKVRVALVPLFKGELRADELLLEGARIHLARDAQGHTNWDDLVQAAEQRASGSAPGRDEGLASFMIGGLRIEDAAVHWEDAESGTVLDVAPLDLHTGPVASGKPVDVSLHAGVRTGEPALDLVLQLEARLHPDGGFEQLRVDPLQATLRAQGPALDGRRVDLDLQGPLTAALEGPRVQWTGLRLQARATGPDLPEEGAHASLRGNVYVDMSQGTARFEPLDLSVDGVALEGQCSAHGLPDKPAWTLALKSATFSPRDLLKRWGVEVKTADPGVLKTAQLQLDAEGAKDRVELRKLSATLDATHLQASGSVEGFAKPVIRFEARLDTLDADRYLPPPAEQPAGEPAKAPEGGTSAAGGDRLALPAETLRNLDVDGKLTLDRLKISGMQLRKITARLRVKEGKASVDPFGVALYGGTVKGGAAADVREQTPRYAAHFKAESIAVGDLLSDLQGAEARIRGTAAGSARLSTRGERVTALKRALSGELAVSLVDGALRDRKLARALEHVIAFLQKREPRPAGEEILFESIRATGKIRQGVLHNDDLQMVTPLVLAKGAGTVDIGADSVDYVLRVALAVGGRDKERVFVPITVKGPFDDLAYGVDLKAVAKERLRQEVEKRVEEQVGKQVGEQLEQVAPGAGGAVGEALKKGLGGFLGR